MYDLGDPVALSVTVRDAAGLPAAAGSVSLVITLPDGSTTSPAVTTPSTGTYVASYTPTNIGRHTVRWIATGANASAFTDVFDVRPAASTQLFSLADARAMLNLKTTANDEELRDYIDATTAAVEFRVGAVIPRTVTETVVARSTIALNITPVISITAINSTLIAGWQFAPGDLAVDPATGILRLYNRGQFSGDLYTITYIAGRAGIVPPAISLAGRIILKHLWRTQLGPTARPGGSDTMAVPGAGFAIPNAAAELLLPYQVCDGIA